MSQINETYQFANSLASYLVLKIQMKQNDLLNEPNNTNASREIEEQLEKLLKEMNDEIYLIYENQNDPLLYLSIISFLSSF